MGADRTGPLAVLGLGGDGDEVDAVTDVEKCFGVVLDYDDAPNWRSTGDVYASLLKALPPETRDAPDNWARFCEAISQQTGVDPLRITPETVLLGRPVSRWALLAFGLLVLAIPWVVELAR